VTRLAVIALLLCAGAAPARAASPAYAIVIGNNAPPATGEGLTPLRYADDDAVRYYQLFSRFAETHLLAVLDDTTQRRYRGLAGAAEPPTLANLERAVAQIARRIETDRARGQQPVFYFAFSGHGSVGADGEAFLALTDAALTQTVLYDRVLARVPASTAHLLIDACHASGVVGVRGGFFDREVDGQTATVTPGALPLAEGGQLARFPHVGVVLATTLGEEAHEWSAIEAGVFTHELLSGLLGAADVNGDARVEYSEAEAFVAAANRNVKDPRAIPQVVARPPAANHNAPLIALDRLAGARRLEGDPSRLGHFHIELEDGQRYLDANLAAGSRASLVLPERGAVFVRTETHEGVVPGGRRVALADVPMRRREVAARGSIAATYQAALFSAPYGASYYQGYVDSVGGAGVEFGRAADVEHRGAAPAAGHRRLAVGLAVLAVAAGAAAVTTGVMAWDARRDYRATDLQRPAQEAQDRLERYRAIAVVTGVGAAASGVLAWWLWPRAQTRLVPAGSGDGELGMAIEGRW
jgi:hypothetical protein